MLNDKQHFNWNPTRQETYIKGTSTADPEERWKTEAAFMMGVQLSSNDALSEP